MTAETVAVDDANQVLGFGISFRDLYRAGGLARIDETFIRQLRAKVPVLAERLLAARSQPQDLSRAAEAELLLALGPALERFIGTLFCISEACAELAETANAAEPFFRIKWKFVRRQAALGISPDEVQGLDGSALRSQLQGWFERSNGATPWAAEAFEAEFVRAVTAWQAEGHSGGDPVEPTIQKLEAARRYAAWAVHTEAGQRWHANGRLFRLPRPRSAPPDLAHDQTETGHARDGFDLTDDGGPALAALDEARYCLHCHKQGNDSCAHGLQGSKVMPNVAPGVVPIRSDSLSGCPLEERISEFLFARTQGLPVTALALIMIENPFCAATGHRICNDCSKACVFQQQTPVDIPRAETRTLRDVLELPWGFEIYSLLTRWNPLNLKRPLPRPPTGHKVLVAGLGPAGFTLAHHLMQDGHAVFAIDGLKLEPLEPALAFQPIVEIESLIEPLSKRMPRGFGGVAEYGITVRWDKNFLTLIRLLLERREAFALSGGVRLGGTITLDDAFAMGFDHVSLATGAGAPAMIDIPGGLARGVRTASDFLMGLQSTGAARRDSVANLQIRMPVVVIGGGLTAMDTATEAGAYYISHVERFLDREESITGSITALMTGSIPAPERSAEDQSIAEEFIAHGRAVRAERAEAAASGRRPDFGPLLAAWGGVTVVYRRSLVESPAYRLNPDELESALYEGVKFIENQAPTEIETDEYGAARAVWFKRSAQTDRPAANPDPVRRPARSVFIAAGTRPNTVAATEPGNTPLRLQGEWFLATNELGEPVTPEFHRKPALAQVLAGRREDGRFVSFFGDLHPSWSGSVVRAMASALRGHPVISQVLANRPPADPRPFAQFAEDCQSRLTATVVRVQRLAPRILEIVIHAPMAAQNFQPGQFFKLQNFESSPASFKSPREQPSSQRSPATTIEPLALTGAWVDQDAGLIGTVVLEMGASSNACADLQEGERVVLMGPTGAPTTIPSGETVVLIGGGLGNAVLFSIGAAMRAAGSRVLYFAGYRTTADRFRVADLEAAADTVVWCCDQTPGFTPGRAQDLAFQGNVVEAMKAYGEGLLGQGAGMPIRLQEANRMLAIGSDRMMAAVAKARHHILKDILPADHIALGSINSPMQCMLKGVCGQCLQWLRDPETGQTRFVFSCHTQDQPLDAVDFAVLQQRLAQNRLEESQTLHWLDACVRTNSPAV